MDNKTQEALKMAIEALKWLRMRSPIIYEESEAEKACKEALAQPAQEPVLNVVKILNEFPLLDDEGLDEDKHHCEWTLQQDRKRLHAMLKTHPAPAIEQEPVAWIEVTTHHEKYQTSKVILLDKGIKLPHDTPLYIHPAPSWQGLSDDETQEIIDNLNNPFAMIRVAEMQLKEKNT